MSTPYYFDLGDRDIQCLCTFCHINEVATASSTAVGDKHVVHNHVKKLLECDQARLYRRGCVVFQVASEGSDSEKVPIVEVMQNTKSIDVGKFSLTFAVKRLVDCCNLYICGFDTNVNVTFELSLYDDDLNRKFNSIISAKLGPSSKLVQVSNQYYRKDSNPLWLSKKLTFLISFMRVEFL